MFYDFTLTIPANTLESSPLEQTVKVTHGVLHRVEIAFPAGCAKLVHLVILHREFQLYPTNPGGSFASDNYTIPIDDYYELFDVPFSLELRGWSPGTRYEHEIVVRIGILPEDVAANIYGKRRKVDRTRLFESFGIPPPGG